MEILLSVVILLRPRPVIGYILDMSRRAKSPQLQSRNSRRILKQRPKPYSAKLFNGHFLDYYKGVKGGTWYGRRYAGNAQYERGQLGIADDLEDGNGINVLSFDQAQDAARVWFKRKSQEDSGEVIAGSYTVASAMADYLKDRERVRRKELSRTRSVVDTHILPTLGRVELAKLTHGKVKTWRDTIAESSPRVRNKPDAKEQAYREIDANDPDAIRKRQATANRILTVLKAALNYAYKESRVASRAAWEKVTPFREVDVAKVRYLTVEECKRLIGVCPEDFRALVRAALYTGCRYGELTALRVDAFNQHTNTVHIERSKSGKGRYIPLTDEGAAFFATVTKGRSDKETMFTHADGVRQGAPWEHSQQRYWMDSACSEAKIAPAIGFHILRHTYASQLAMNGTPMPVIASLLGHADTRMTEKHYGHMSPSYVADTLRMNLPSFGFGTASGQLGKPTHAQFASKGRKGRVVAIAKGRKVG